MNSHIIPPDILYCIVNVPSTLSGTDFARLCRVSYGMRSHAERRLYSKILLDMNSPASCKRLLDRISESQNRLCHHIRSLEVRGVREVDNLTLETMRLFSNRIVPVLCEMSGLLDITLIGTLPLDAGDLLKNLPTTIHTARFYHLIPDCWEPRLNMLPLKELVVDNSEPSIFTPGEFPSSLFLTVPQR